MVDARIRSSQEAEAACGDLPGITERGFSASADLPPVAFGEGVHWTVEGRAHADDVADCLRRIGAIEVQISEPSEPKSFENTGP